MKLALLAAVATVIGAPPGGRTLTATPAESAAYQRVQAYLQATGRLVDAVRSRDLAGFSGLVAPGTTMFRDGRNQPFALTSLAPLVDRCRAEQSVRLGIDDEVTLYWICPGDRGPTLQTLFKYRGDHVAWAATERAVVHALPAPPAR